MARNRAMQMGKSLSLESIMIELMDGHSPVWNTADTLQNLSGKNIQASFPRFLLRQWHPLFLLYWKHDGIAIPSLSTYLSGLKRTKTIGR